MNSNKLIASFAGFQETKIGWYDSQEILSDHTQEISGGNTFDNLLFDKSWDWLMPVINIICDICFGDNDFRDENYYEIIDRMPNLTDVYNGVVEFIKLYNRYKPQ